METIGSRLELFEVMRKKTHGHFWTCDESGRFLEDGGDGQNFKQQKQRKAKEELHGHDE